METTRERGYTGSTNNTADGSAGTPASAAARSKANLISSSTAPSTGDKKKSKPISENIRDDVDSPASEDSEPEPDSSDEEEGCDKKPVKPPRVAVQRKSLDSKAARRISDEEIKVPKHKERPKSMAFSALTGGLVAAPSSSTAVATKNEQASRLSLFGTSTAKTDKEAETRVNGTINTMNEINERLKQRGERLTRLQDRTEDLANNAGEFAKMAKQLKEQQKKSSGWF